MRRYVTADDGDSSSIEEDTIEPPVIAQVSSEGENAVCARGWNRLMGSVCWQKLSVSGGTTSVWYIRFVKNSWANSELKHFTTST